MGIIRFGSFEVDLRAGELRRNGATIKVQEQPFRVLMLLLEHPGEVVTREELRQAIWPNTAFGTFDEGIDAAIYKLRSAIGDSAEHPRFVETLPRRGYRFIAPVDTVGPAAEARAWRVKAKRMPLALAAGLAVLAVVLHALSAGGLPWPWARGGTPPRIHSLVVLPLRNLSSDSTQDYFADGMTEELTTTLGMIEALRVIAHRSALQFRQSDRSAPEIARLLNVKHVVDGSVLQDGDRIRITATLIDAETNTAIWGERFERERRDAMALQREVALAIARAIEVALTPQDLRRLDGAIRVDPEAFDLYVKGTQARYRITGYTEQGYREAADYFALAVARDSGYAPAYAGLASAHAFLGDRSRAELFATKALKLDSSLAETHVVLGLIRQFYYWDWAGAENAFRQAIGHNPGYAEAHHELSMLLMRQRRFDEAIREAQLTLYLAPMSARFMDAVAEIQIFRGRYDEALSAADKSLALDSSSGFPYLVQGVVYAEQARYEDAADALKTCMSRGCPEDVSLYLAYISAVSGRRAEARKVLAVWEARWIRGSQGIGGCPLYGFARVYAGLGDREKALAWLERAVATPGPFACSPFTVYVGIDPTFRSLHAEPRFQALLKKVGLQE